MGVIPYCPQSCPLCSPQGSERLASGPQSPSRPRSGARGLCSGPRLYLPQARTPHCLPVSEVGAAPMVQPAPGRRDEGPSGTTQQARGCSCCRKWCASCSPGGPLQVRAGRSPSLGMCSLSQWSCHHPWPQAGTNQITWHTPAPCPHSSFLPLQP